eukprot:237970_1
MERGLPINLPHIYKKIHKCTSVDPLFKLCFDVNPTKRMLHIKVRVPGLKKAMNGVLREAELTPFQARMFGNKVGNALHDIAKNIKIPSVGKAFRTMKVQKKLRTERRQRKAERLQKRQEKMLKKYKLMGQNGKNKMNQVRDQQFKIKCPAGEPGAKCRRRRARMNGRRR